MFSNTLRIPYHAQASYGLSKGPFFSFLHRQHMRMAAQTLGRTGYRYVPESDASALDTHPLQVADRPEVLKKKLQACSINFDFNSPTCMAEKEAKRQALLELVEYVRRAADARRTLELGALPCRVFCTFRLVALHMPAN